MERYASAKLGVVIMVFFWSVEANMVHNDWIVERVPKYIGIKMCLLKPCVHFSA